MQWDGSAACGCSCQKDEIRQGKRVRTCIMRLRLRRARHATVVQHTAAAAAQARTPRHRRAAYSSSWSARWQCRNTADPTREQICKQQSTQQRRRWTTRARRSREGPHQGRRCCCLSQTGCHLVMQRGSAHHRWVRRRTRRPRHRCRSRRRRRCRSRRGRSRRCRSEQGRHRRRHRFRSRHRSQSQDEFAVRAARLTVLAAARRRVRRSAAVKGIPATRPPSVAKRAPCPRATRVENRKFKQSHTETVQQTPTPTN
jgi:hypothetical protein